MRTVSIMLFLVCIISLSLMEPSWPQVPGVGTDLEVKDDTSRPLSQPDKPMVWNLKDLLLGVKGLQKTALKLNAEQEHILEKPFNEVVKGSLYLDNFNTDVERVLTEEQVEYLQQYLDSGKLVDLPQEPETAKNDQSFANQVLEMLQKKAKSSS